MVFTVEGDGEDGQLLLARELFEGADDAVEVLLVGEVDIHGDDDLEVVDEGDGARAGFTTVARDLGANEVEGGFVVALAEPEVLRVCAVALLGFREVRDLGGRIVGG